MKKELLYHFFEGNCTEEEVREVRAWVESSAENKKEFFRESKVYDAIDILAEDDKLSDSRPSMARKIWINIIKAAAIAAIVLLVEGVWEYVVDSKSDRPMNIVYVPAGRAGITYS